MSSESRTFSESWYRICNQSLSLRAQVKVRRQFFRGEKWYVLHDPFNNQFFRLRPAAYDFVAHLRYGKTVEEVWKECLERNPDDAPGQEDVIQLLAQLYHANLLHYKIPPDSAKLFERHRKQRRREVTSKLLSIMFARFPLIDPDAFLVRTLPAVRPFLGWFGFVIWFATVGYAAKVVLDNFDAVKLQTQGILAPGNLFLLYAGLVILKTIHEFGHAYVCRHFGGEVHDMGVMLLVFTPIPFMDATSAWSFRSRGQRIYVAAAGMLIEVFVAAIATVCWANTGAGTFHSLCYNMMFIASISTIIFNINPLLRFDGYYILSDMLDIPNLHTHSRQQLVHLVEYYCFGCKKSTSPANSASEAFWLTFFGILAGIYRIVVFTGIVLFVADKFLIAGLLMAAFCFFSWVLVPTGKLLKYLASSPKLDRTRRRAIFVTVGFVTTVFALLYVVPFPNRFRAPGVLETKEHPFVVNGASGYLAQIFDVKSGDAVTEGQKLIQLHDQELEFQLAETEARYQEALFLLRQSLNNGAVELRPIQSRLNAIEKQLRRLQRRHASLVVVANQDGIFTAPELDTLVGMWIPRGTVIGQIVNQDAYQFSAIVSQDEASRLFSDEIREDRIEVRLRGQAAIMMPVTSLLKVPAEQSLLPSAAMGWSGGGDVAVDLTDPSGRKAAETFFKVEAAIEPSPDVELAYGRSGSIRYELQPEPLLHQWMRKIRQLLQQRYQI